MKTVKYVKISPFLLDEHVNFFLNSDRRKKVQLYVQHNKDLFDSEAHFYRCAVEHFLGECQRKGLKNKRAKK